MEKIVQIFSNDHVNLDSLPLRYGLHFLHNTTIKLDYDQNTLKEGKKPGRYSIFANFINPQSKKLERGFFILINNFKKDKLDKVITVIRDNTDTEYHLSSVMKDLRESGEITTNDLLEMHPLYKENKLNKHSDLIKYLVDKKNSKSANNIIKISDDTISKLESANIHIDDLEDELDTVNKDSDRKDEVIEALRQRIEELNKISENLNTERSDANEAKRNIDYPSVNWGESTVTTGIFDYWSEVGDFLHIYLLGINQPIRLKNTFKYDYPRALVAAKKLSKGERFDYVTKGIGTFNTHEWFSEILNPQGYSPLAELTHTVLENLQKQTYVPDNIFKIIHATRYPGKVFLEQFNLDWKKDMMILNTDKGWFIDATDPKHGGTEWIEGQTYHNCRVTMTRGNKLPYWLQKNSNLN